VGSVTVSSMTNFVYVSTISERGELASELCEPALQVNKVNEQVNKLVELACQPLNWQLRQISPSCQLGEAASDANELHFIT